MPTIDEPSQESKNSSLAHFEVDWTRITTCPNIVRELVGGLLRDGWAQVVEQGAKREPPIQTGDGHADGEVVR